MKSKNILMTAPEAVELREEEIPALAPDEVLLQNSVSLISTGTECIIYRGQSDEGTHWHGWLKYPFYLGYSAATRVVETGSAVKGFTPGDRVFVALKHCQFLVAKCPGHTLVKIPDSIGDEEAAWSKLSTIAQTAVRRAALKMGATVAIVGLGPLGQLVAQYCRAMGAAEVIAIDPVAHRLEIARKLGATLTFQGTASEALRFVEDYSAGRRADVVFEITGHYAVLPQALPLARKFGTLVLLGDCPFPSKQHLTNDIVTRQVNIIGSHNENMAPGEEEWIQGRQIELFYRYLERKQMNVADLITHRYKPEQAPEAYAQLIADRSQTVGVVFDWREMNKIG